MLLDRYLALYDADPANAATLRELVSVIGAEDAALLPTNLHDLRRHPRADRIRAALVRAAEALAVDRLRPGHGLNVPDWREATGALPDGLTVLLRAVSRSAFLRMAGLSEMPPPGVPPLRTSVFVPLARMSLGTAVTFAGAWDPEREGVEQARARLRREFETTLTNQLSMAAARANGLGMEPAPEPLEEDRDLRWLYWNVRHRLPWGEFAARSAHELDIRIDASDDPEGLVKRAVSRMGARVGVRTRRLA